MSKKFYKIFLKILEKKNESDQTKLNRKILKNRYRDIKDFTIPEKYILNYKTVEYFHEKQTKKIEKEV